MNMCVYVMVSNPGLLHSRWILYQLSHKGSMCIYIHIYIYVYIYTHTYIHIHTQEMIFLWRYVIRHRNQDNALSKNNGLQ